MISKVFGQCRHMIISTCHFYHKFNHYNHYTFASKKIDKSKENLSIYDLYTSKTHFNHKIKSFSYRFKNQQIMLYCYFTQPNIHQQLNQQSKQQKTIIIESNNILTLTFVHSTSQEMSDTAWQQRKVVLLNFKQVMQILKLKPYSQQTKQLIQYYDLFMQDQNKELKFKKTINIMDFVNEKEIHFNIKEEQINDQNQPINIKWELKYVFLYEDYISFLEALKKNIIFISGSAISIQITKLNHLFKPEQKNNSANKVDNKVTKQKGQKIEKTVKEKKTKTTTKKTKTQ